MPATAQHVAFGVATGRRPPARNAAAQRPGAAHRREPLLSERQSRRSPRLTAGPASPPEPEQTSGTRRAPSPRAFRPPWPYPISNSARIGRWSEPAWGKTTPATGRSAPRTRMWSIWLWGRQEGQLRPITARRQPRHEQLDQRPPRVHVPGQHGVGPGLGAQPPPQLGEVARRAVEQVRHVDAADGDRPAVDGHVDHDGGASHAVGPQEAQLQYATGLNREIRAAPGRRSPCCRARPPASGSGTGRPRCTGRTPSM